jgi:MoaA/NifB/PqqE/SkfB family radical SAM enzyme
MNLILTNLGYRYADGLSNPIHCRQTPAYWDDSELLGQLRTEYFVPYRKKPREDNLISQGLATTAPESLSRDEIMLRYKRNPLEHIQQVAFEFTTLCNLNCAHCYNATVPRVTEGNIEALKSAVDVFLAMGIRRFDFIGGEVSKYGIRWLEVVRHIRCNSDAAITLFTSGWWCGKRHFKAAGKVYNDSKDYLAELHRSGLTHVVFSIDGLRSEHDRSRRCPGLFDRVISSFNEVRNAGLEPRVALLVRKGSTIAEDAEILSLISQRIGRPVSIEGQMPQDDSVVSSPVAVCSNLIDIGNQARIKRSGLFYLPCLAGDMLYCKGFYRPSPILTIKANGEVATCRLANAGEGYGNIHISGLLHTLNHLQDSFVFQLHAEHKVGEYRAFVDYDFFGKYFDHICTPRAILTLLARRMHESGTNTTSKETLRRMNLEVARITGHQPH